LPLGLLIHLICSPSQPARVVQWLNQLGAMCSRAWRAEWPRSGVQSEPWPSKAHPPTKK